MIRQGLALTVTLAIASVAGAQTIRTEATRRAQDAGLRYSVPQTWERVPAPSDMRAAQYKIDGGTLEPSDDGELVLFFFGEGKGGTTDANLERWYGQFGQKSLADALRVGGDVHGIVGATLSAQATTAGVRRALALYAVLLAKEG